jgi:uncharacterized protein YbjQ (UPF0145 family)
MKPWRRTYANTAVLTPTKKEANIWKGHHGQVRGKKIESRNLLHDFFAAISSCIF